jgi:hypothetical protein
MGDDSILEEFKDVPREIKIVIVNERLQLWKNTQFRAYVDISISKKLQDKKLEVDATREMTTCEIAIKQLEQLLKDITEQP